MVVMMTMIMMRITTGVRLDGDNDNEGCPGYLGCGRRRQKRQGDEGDDDDDLSSGFRSERTREVYFPQSPKVTPEREPNRESGLVAKYTISLPSDAPASPVGLPCDISFPLFAGMHAPRFSIHDPPHV